MKRAMGVFTLIIIVSLVTFFLSRPMLVEGTVTSIKVNPEDIKEVVYKVNIQTVAVELNTEIDKVARLAFVNYNKLEALQLIELLTSDRVLIASVDPDRGFVFDYGFIRRAN